MTSLIIFTILDRRVDIGVYQRDFEKAMDAENNLVKEIRSAKEKCKRKSEEATNAILALKAAEEHVKSLEDSLPKVQEEADSKRLKLDGILISTCRIIIPCKIN